MNDRESEFGRKIARCLDQGIADLRPGTVYRLQQARGAALAAASSAHRTVPELATAGGHGGSAGRASPRSGSLRWLGLALLCGVLDMTANALYLVAARTGPLSMVVTLASLYPASTVLLARVVLGERLNARQVVGVVCALAAIVLIVRGGGAVGP